MLRKIQPCDQNTNNLLQRFANDTGCCSDSSAGCRYTFTVPDASTVTGLTVTNCAGETQALTLPAGLLASSVGPLAIARALLELIVSAGYGTDERGAPTFDYLETGTDNVINFYGECPILSVQRSSGGDLTVTSACTEINRCHYYLAWPGGNAHHFIVDGADDTLGDLTLSTHTAADVKTALDALVPSSSQVWVYENATPNPDVYEIYIKAPYGSTFALGAAGSEVAFSESNCHPDYR